MRTRDEVLAVVEREGSQAAAARALGISRQRVQQVVKPTPRSNEMRRALCARNRARGRLDDRKICRRCARATKKVALKYRTYARKNNCTIAEAQIATRTRRWRKQ